MKPPVMTLAASRKLTFRLTKAQKIKRAGERLNEASSQPRKPVTLKELERRASEVASGRVKAIPGAIFDADLEAMKKTIGHPKHILHRA